MHISRRLFAATILLLVSFTLANAQILKPDIQVGRGQVVDIHIPDIAQPKGLFRLRKKVPVLVYVHGGGWIRGSQKKVYNLPAYANSRGYMLVSVSYRPVPRTNIDGQVNDVIRAIRWTRNNIAAYGGDRKRLSSWGIRQAHIWSRLLAC